jgi:hypothetical protein
VLKKADGKMSWKSTIKGPHEQFHGHKFDDLDEMKQFIENQSTTTYARRKNTGSRVGIEYIGSVSNNCPRQKAVGLGCPSGLVAQHLKQNRHKFFTVSSRK